MRNEVEGMRYEVRGNSSLVPRTSYLLPRTSEVRLGLGANWPQFSLLVLVNDFVGGMVGLERAVVPLLAEREFGLTSKAAILSFILSFGLVSAFANLGA